MQLPLPLPHTFPMLLCCPGRFHHLLLCCLFYWESWFYVLHWAENFISFLASRQVVFRVGLEHLWFLSVWTEDKPAKEWGALSHSQGFHNPLQAGIKKLDVRVAALLGEGQTWFMSAFPLLSAYYISHLMHKGLGWTWTHQSRKRQET